MPRDKLGRYAVNMGSPGVSAAAAVAARVGTPRRISGNAINDAPGPMGTSSLNERAQERADFLTTNYDLRARQAESLARSSATASIAVRSSTPRPLSVGYRLPAEAVGNINTGITAGIRVQERTDYAASMSGINALASSQRARAASPPLPRNPPPLPLAFPSASVGWRGSAPPNAPGPNVGPGFGTSLPGRSGGGGSLGGGGSSSGGRGGLSFLGTGIARSVATTALHVGVAYAVFKVMEGMGQAAEEAREFSGFLARIQGTAEAAGISSEGLGPTVVASSLLSGLPIKDITSATRVLIGRNMPPEQVPAALSNLTNLAQATGSPLGPITSQSSEIQHAWGMKPEQMGRITETLFRSSARGGVPVEEMGEALAEIGPQAHQAAISIEEISSAIALIVKRGVTSPTARFAMRTLFSQLASPSVKQRELAAFYGVPFSEGGLSELGMGEWMKRFGNIPAEARGTLLGSSRVASSLAALTSNPAEYTAELAFQRAPGTMASNAAQAFYASSQGRQARATQELSANLREAGPVPAEIGIVATRALSSAIGGVVGGTRTLGEGRSPIGNYTGMSSIPGIGGYVQRLQEPPGRSTLEGTLAKIVGDTVAPGRSNAEGRKRYLNAAIAAGEAEINAAGGPWSQILDIEQQHRIRATGITALQGTSPESIGQSMLLQKLEEQRYTAETAGALTRGFPSSRAASFGEIYTGSQDPTVGSVMSVMGSNADIQRIVALMEQLLRVSEEGNLTRKKMIGD